MRHLTKLLGLLVCAMLTLAAGCGDEDTPDDPGTTGGEDAGMTDTGSSDGGETDAGAGDTGIGDTGSEDAGGEDTGAVDTGGEDTGGEDVGSDDTGGEDAGSEDAGTGDTGSEDAGSEDAGGMDAGDMDAGEDAGADTGEDGRRSPIRIRAYADGIELDDGQGTSSATLTIEGSITEALAGATVSYGWNGARYRTVELDGAAFTFDRTLTTGENLLVVRAARRGEDPVEVSRTYYSAIGSRAGTHDLQCRGSTSPANAERCEELCDEYGGEYDPSWGNIGGCRNMPGSSVGADLDFTDPDAPAPTERATTHDQQCLGSTSAANREACEELCGEYGGTYDPDWGNIGGCRDMPGSALNDLDFTDGSIYPAPPARGETRDQQCLGSTSDTNRTRCQELCEDYGGTYDGTWGNIGGCRGMPASAGDLDFTDGTIRPDEPDS